MLRRRGEHQPAAILQVAEPADPGAARLEMRQRPGVDLDRLWPLQTAGPFVLLGGGAPRACRAGTGGQATEEGAAGQTETSHGGGAPGPAGRDKVAGKVSRSSARAR